MYISDDERNRNAEQCAVSYSAATLFCAVLSAVYEHFSHGVYSDSMIYLFLYPLLFGAVPFFVLRVLIKLRYPGKWSRCAWHGGVATLSAGCFMRGVLEIYGTDSDLLSVFLAAGTALCISAWLFYMIFPNKRKTE